MDVESKEKFKFGHFRQIAGQSSKKFTRQCRLTKFTVTNHLNTFVVLKNLGISA